MESVNQNGFSPNTPPAPATPAPTTPAPSSKSPKFAQTLVDASWRGQKFYIRDISRSGGRKTIPHEYFGRDEPWLEDLGQATQQISITGFLIGDDVYAQRKTFDFNCNKVAGNGNLVLPSQGPVSCGLIGYTLSETVENGNMLPFTLTLIPNSQKTYPGLTYTKNDGATQPSSATNTQAAVTTATANLKDATSSDFFTQVGDAIKKGERAIDAVLKPIETFTKDATRILGDATKILGTVKGLGNLLTVASGASGRLSFGRFGNGFLSGPNAVIGSINAGLSDVKRVESGVNSALNSATDIKNTAVKGFNDLSSLVGDL
jgi:prophage DNA circulation protein